MSGALAPALLAGIVSAAFLLIRIPRALFAEVSEERPSRRLEWSLVALLTACGVAGFAALPDSGLSGRTGFAVALMALAGVVYSDLRFLVIPDLYSLVLGLVAITAPWRLPLGEIAVGALVCGGLLAVLAFLWRRLARADGLGFGDVKLAAAVGALLGAQAGLIAISVSAAGAAVLAYGVQVARRTRSPLIPYGAALALAGAGFLAWRLT